MKLLLNQVKLFLNHKKTITTMMTLFRVARKLFGEGNAKLPLPPMLMFDRITKLIGILGNLKKDL